jgi:hypothetical protein
MDAFAVTESILPEPEKPDVQDDRNAISGSLGEEANKFQRAISSWRGMNV